MTYKIEQKGFTLVEMMLVMVVLGIVAMIAVPMVSSASIMKLKAAANKVASDLEYAKSMAISRQQYYSVAFDHAHERYQVQDNAGVVLENPLNQSKDYIVDFYNESRLSGVMITSIDFDGSSTITFDYLGSPLSGVPGSMSNLTDGANGVNLSAGNGSRTIKILVEPVTGYVSIEE